MNDEKYWGECVALSKHYLAIGQTEIYIRTDDLSRLPWQHVTEMPSGGLSRYGTSVSRWFKAVHPCGLTFKWSIDAEMKESNGTGALRFDIDKMRAVAELLPPNLKQTFKDSFTDAVGKLTEQAAEYEGMAARLRMGAAQLKALL